MPVYFELGSGREAEGEVISFQGSYLDQQVSGLITREALEDLWGSAPPADNWVDLFKLLEREIFDLAAAKVRRGLVEPDGSVAVRIGDRQILKAVR
ncbi:hypothetical protein ACFB49_22070 [Sphingomonas sp. DBB INV C78]|uniref:hypothetical protein n=1 Tax=Sphingomonas sp. DBB INV C78 TaxID=3349434 RepID=UPI0036D27E38